MKNNIRYIPYNDAQVVPAENLIVVDSYYHRGLNLTHLYSDRVPQSYRSNTSTETVLKWLADESPDKIGSNSTVATCNHWDIDGFLSVWCILNAELALNHSELIIATAHLGDFREFDDATEIGLHALRLCAILNAVEAQEFCLPFGDLDNATIEYQVSIKKFEYFLPRFSEWLLDTDNFRNLWENEYNTVLFDLQFIREGNALIEEHRNPDISVIKTPRPLHYYAAFSCVSGGAVLTEIRDPHYIEFEYRYETAVGRLDKIVLERIDLSPLVEVLNQIETNDGVRWVFDNINEGGTMLRPEFTNAPSSREDRYQNFSYRIANGFAAPTSMSSETLLKLIQQCCIKEKERTDNLHALSSSAE